MIKKVIAAALVTVVASQADAAVFNGFAVGVNGGVLMAHNELSLKIANAPKFKNANKTLGVFGVQFDYEMSKSNSLYSRFGVLLSMPTGKASSTTKLVGHDWSYTAKNGLMTEFQAAMGYNFCNDVVAYGLVGISISKKTYTLKIDSVNVLKKKNANKTQSSPVLGLGMMKKVNNNLSVGVEYKHTFEDGAKIFTNATLTQELARIKSNSDAVLARVSYHF